MPEELHDIQFLMAPPEGVTIRESAHCRPTRLNKIGQLA
jgi:hypothetical protein